MATIDLREINKAAVLATLYNASKPQGMRFLQYDPTPMTVKEAEELLKHQTDFDYLKGRVMKINLEGDTLDTWDYDQENGVDAAQMAIDSYLKTLKSNNRFISKTHSDNTFMQAVSTEAQLDNESYLSVEGKTAVLHLGMSEYKDVIAPKIKQAKEKNQSK